MSTNRVFGETNRVFGETLLQAFDEGRLEPEAASPSGKRTGTALSSRPWNGPKAPKGQAICASDVQTAHGTLDIASCHFQQRPHSLRTKRHDRKALKAQ